MADVVIDATVFCAIFLNEEGCERLKEELSLEGECFAPAFWKFEAANAVWKRKEITDKIGKELVATIWQFPIASPEPDGWPEEAYSIAKKNNITFYDAAYIAMAKLLRLPIWTLDKRQADIARQCRVQVIV